MHDRSVKVFDETIQDTFVGIAAHSYRAVTWSSIEHSDFLVRADQLVVQAVVSVMVGVEPVPLTITLQHSGDGRTWHNKWVAIEGRFSNGEKPDNLDPGAAEERGERIKKRELPSNSLWAGEPSPRPPTLQFARWQIDVGDGKNPFKIRTTILVTARTRTKPSKAQIGQAAEEGPSSNPAIGSPLVPGRRSLAEVGQTLQSMAHLEGSHQREEVLRALSPTARKDLTALSASLRSLSPEQRDELARSARAFADSLAGVARTDVLPEPSSGDACGCSPKQRKL